MEDDNINKQQKEYRTIVDEKIKQIDYHRFEQQFKQKLKVNGMDFDYDEYQW